ncbi:MAG: hypothetical protein U1E38_10025 [Rhodospirillales bacterium]
MDADEDPPWPNPELVGRWWEDSKAPFTASQRYLCGQPISTPTAERCCAPAYQRASASAPPLSWR